MIDETEQHGSDAGGRQEKAATGPISPADAS